MANLLFSVLFVLPALAAASVVTSVDKIKNMVLQENFILDNLRAGLKSNTKFREFYTERTTAIRSKNFTQLISDLEHPNGLYNTVIKYADDYKSVKEIVRTKTKKASHEYLFKQLDKFSDADDIIQARLSLIRLQSVYGLKPKDMIAGDYKGVKGPTLSGQEAFLIGWTAFQDFRNKQCVEWLREALKMVKPNQKKERETYTNIADLGQFNQMHDLLYLEDGTSEITIKAMLARALVRLNEMKEARKIMTELVSIQGGMDDAEATILKSEIDEYPRPRFRDRGYSDDDKKYFSMCKKDKTVTPFKSPELFCRWKSLYVPYFRFGEEILSWAPYVSIFYNVINEFEVEAVKGMARNKLYRGATVSKGGHAQDERRTSHLTFLEDWDSPMINWASGRIGRLTGLNMPVNIKKHRFELSCAEPMQVVNYGIGGHYSFHTDPVVFDTPDTEHVVIGSGDRMATFLLYLSEVEKGGATVFPRLDISIKPKKRSALFWYNYTPEGKVDPATVHAGCPVVVGEKWVANKWILNHGNTFSRRCGLNDITTQKEIDPWMMRDWKPTPEMLRKIWQVVSRLPMTKAQRRRHFLARMAARMAAKGR